MSGATRVIDAIRASTTFAPGARRIVAYSGGLDSTVLLHALATYARISRNGLLALHIDHRLHPQSPTWAEACRETANALGIDCEVRVAADTPPRQSGIEQWAREVRYAAFADILAPGDVVVMAHHRDDLAETVLLRLLRGAGPEGLAGMPATRALGRGHLLRPLLAVPRADIEDYATAHELEWSEDPSNADPAYDRNYVRHHVVPGLLTRWPGAVDQIARVAELQAGAASGLRAYADRLLGEALDGEHGGLAIGAVVQTEPGMLSWVLRRWLERQGLPQPDAVHLAELQRMILARTDANPSLAYKGAEVRRYRGRLYAGPARGSVDLAPRAWSVAMPLNLAWGELRAVPARGEGIARAAIEGKALSVRFRAGGERCRLPGRDHHHALKHLFQQWGVPPWQRADTPLLYVDGDLAAVGGYCVCQPYVAAAGEESVRIEWRRTDGPPGITS